MATVECYFDIVSPASYIAWHRLPEIAERTGATIDWKPFFLGGVMQATGNRPPGMLPARGAYMDKDFARCCKRYGLPYAMNPAFPMNTLPVQRALAAWVGTEDFRTLGSAVYAAAWGAQKNIAEPDVLSEVVREAGLDVDAFWAAANDAANKDKVKALTAEAVERGAFGAPTFFVGDEIFFGQDRLDYVEEALAG